ncbi:hypothetical protein BJV82DRAFT_698311, partial [Fennellomyces sp. T-0311]
TVLWRLYRHRVSCRLNLHNISAEYFPSPNCILCGLADSEERFFFSCSLKSAVWRSFSQSYLDAPHQLTFLHLQTVDPPPLTMKPGITVSTYQFISCGILSI